MTAAQLGSCGCNASRSGAPRVQQQRPKPPAPPPPPPPPTTMLFMRNFTYDPFADFFDWLGGRNATQDICNVLRSSYLNLCRSHPSFTDAICTDFLKAYKSRCDHRRELVSGIGVVAVLAVLVACFLVGNALELVHFTLLPQSGATILIGFVAGAFLKSTVSDLSPFQFDESIFFLLFLPYIVFEAGLTIDKRRFREQLFPIMLFSILGTFTSIFAIGYGLHWGGNILGYQLPLTECLLFGSLISSIDPIATLSVFSSVGVDQTLYILVFGESILNDGVAVVMYDAFVRLIDVPEVGLQNLQASVLRFLVVFFGSILAGLLFGAATALLFKYGRFHEPNVETLLFAAAALFPYYACEHLEWSGIVAVLANSVAMDLYAYQNLSPEAQRHTKFAIKCIAHLLEQCIFAYLGMQVFLAEPLFVWQPTLVFCAIVLCAVSRLWVFPLTGLVNRVRSSADSVPLNHQAMLWFSGLRGAVSFALAMKIPKYDELLGRGSQHVPQLLAATTAVVMFTVFAHGGLTVYVLKWLRIPTGMVQLEPALLAPDSGPLVLLHQRFLEPLLVQVAGPRSPLRWSSQYAAVDCT
eukprot:GGOE01005720.1.p1 GENE.GGOE01005720.1~~GGOE01005720.1.p1  ORF type:complete len:581 (-),score=189.72 GGOE01005720.1:307-2049(-)